MIGPGRVAATPREQEGRTLIAAPLLAVLAVLALAMVVLATGHWRRGSFTIGVAVLLAALLRAVLPTRRVGLLAVRSRVFDVLLTLCAGVALIALTMITPHTHPAQ